MSEPHWSWDPATDWRSEERSQVHAIFASAYDDVDAMKAVAAAAQIKWIAQAHPVSIGEQWFSLLHEASVQARFGALVAQFIADPSKKYWHHPMERQLGERRAEQVRRQAAGLQAYNPRLVRQDGVMAARVPRDQILRTAQIRRGSEPIGTGVLIAPNLLLTAGHVLSRNPSPPPELKSLQLNALFDFNTALGRSVADTGTRVEIDKIVIWLPPSERERNGDTDFFEVEDHELDFAVLKLARWIGTEPIDLAITAKFGGQQRGYYRLAAKGETYNFKRRIGLTIGHHGDGQPYDTAEVLVDDDKFNVTRSRMEYRTDTTAGASGAPIVDRQGRLVGIHNYGSTQSERGVPFSTISDVLWDEVEKEILEPTIAAEPVRTNQPLRVRMLGGEPFLDRDPVRETFEEMIGTGGKRQLVISGDAKLGKSQCVAFLTHIADQSMGCQQIVDEMPGGLEAVVVDVSELPMATEAEREDLVNKIGERLVTRADPDASTQEARSVVNIINALDSRIRRSPDMQWWICLDGIDEPTPLRLARVHDLVKALFDFSRQDLSQHIRVVFSGQKVMQFFGHPDNLLPRIRNKVEPRELTLADAVDWVKAEAAEINLALPARLDEAISSFFEEEIRLHYRRATDDHISKTLETLREHGLPPPELAGLDYFLKELIRAADD